jgi:hypothetical protein
LTHASHACAALARAGLAVASLEYRRVGDSGGGWPSTFEDVIDGFTAGIGYQDDEGILFRMFKRGPQGYGVQCTSCCEAIEAETQRKAEERERRRRETACAFCGRIGDGLYPLSCAVCHKYSCGNLRYGPYNQNPRLFELSVDAVPCPQTEERQEDFAANIVALRGGWSDEDVEAWEPADETERDY